MRVKIAAVAGAARRCERLGAVVVTDGALKSSDECRRWNVATEGSRAGARPENPGSLRLRSAESSNSLRVLTGAVRGRAGAAVEAGAPPRSYSGWSLSERRAERADKLPLLLAVDLGVEDVEEKSASRNTRRESPEVPAARPAEEAAGLGGSWLVRGAARFTDALADVFAILAALVVAVGPAKP